MTTKILMADEKLFDLLCYCDGIGYDLDNNSEYVGLCTRLMEYIDGSFNTKVINNIINDIDNLHNSITVEFGGSKK